jgi:hypothetical protein
VLEIWWGREIIATRIIRRGVLVFVKGWINKKEELSVHLHSNRIVEFQVGE